MHCISTGCPKKRYPILKGFQQNRDTFLGHLTGLIQFRLKLLHVEIKQTMILMPPTLNLRAGPCCCICLFTITDVYKLFSLHFLLVVVRYVLLSLSASYSDA